MQKLQKNSMLKFYTGGNIVGSTVQPVIDALTAFAQ